MRKTQTPALIDIVDQDNNPLGLQASIDEANRKGYWHRLAHAVIRTADGKYLVEKRSGKIIIEPNLLDVSLGGYVDAGETPEQALIREVKEEIGIDITKSQIKFLDIAKMASYHPKFKRYTKGFIYCYLVQLKPGQENFVAQESEVSNIFVLSPQKTRRLIRRYRLPGYGKLLYAHKFYKEVLAQAEAN